MNLYRLVEPNAYALSFLVLVLVLVLVWSLQVEFHPLLRGLLLLGDQACSCGNLGLRVNVYRLVGPNAYACGYSLNESLLQPDVHPHPTSSRRERPHAVDRLLAGFFAGASGFKSA